MTVAAAVAPALALRDLHAGYGSLEVLRGLDIEVRPGEVVLVIGHNGAGKSTIARAVLGLTDFASGRVELCGVDLSGRPVSERVLAGIGYVAQTRGIFPSFSVRHNLELGGYTLRDARELALRVEEQYRRFPALRERAGVAASLLSGGQQRMLSLGIGLMVRPRVIFVDEPSAGLAPKLVAEVMAHVDGIRRENDAAVVLIEQNVAAGLKIADRVYVLRQGRVAGEFNASELEARHSYWDLL
jgi:branched-chain amino acid transport system ATP-binding protein